MKKCKKHKYIMDNQTHKQLVSPIKDFGWALKRLWEGSSVTRKGWKNPQIMIRLQEPDENSFMTEPYLYMQKIYQPDSEVPVASIKRFPVDISCESLLARDWEEIEPENASTSSS